MMQWAAFSSDCKHEIHRVDSGARITVTYNLLAVPPVPIGIPECSLKVRSLDLKQGTLSICNHGVHK